MTCLPPACAWQDYFGERALLTDEPRAASVVAATRVECLVLERSDFNALLGDLETIMQQELRRREEMGGPGKKPAAAAPKKPQTSPQAYLFQDLNIVRHGSPIQQLVAW
jgi:cGMP-dependent protein kinase